MLVPDGVTAGDTHLIPIHLTRGKAFGSGLHETTISCIKALEKIPSLEGISALDVGTGTGILSLAALKLDALRATAVDIEIDAVITCRQNALINGLSERLMVYQGTVDALNPANRFGLIMANIYGDIILKDAHRLAAMVSVGGYMFFSGLDYTDSGPLRASMKEEGMEEVSVVFLEEYVTQVWRHPPGRAEGGL